MKAHGIGSSSIGGSSPTKNDKGDDDGETSAPASATKAGGTKRKSAAGKAGPKATPTKKSRKKVAVDSAERIIGKDEDEEGGSEDEGASPGAGVKQEIDEASDGGEFV